MSSICIPVSVLRNIWDVVKYPPWGEPFKPVIEEDVRNAVLQKSWTSRHMRPLNNNEETREFDHVRRIAWMVMHPPEDPILIETDEIYPIVDGYHRLYAAIIRGDEMINVSISGYDDDIISLFGKDVLDRIAGLNKLNPEM